MMLPCKTEGRILYTVEITGCTQRLKFVKDIQLQSAIYFMGFLSSARCNRPKSALSSKEVRPEIEIKLLGEQQRKADLSTLTVW